MSTLQLPPEESIAQLRQGKFTKEGAAALLTLAGSEKIEEKASAARTILHILINDRTHPASADTRLAVAEAASQLGTSGYGLIDYLTAAAGYALRENNQRLVTAFANAKFKIETDTLTYALETGNAAIKKEALDGAVQMMADIPGRGGWKGFYHSAVRQLGAEDIESRTVVGDFLKQHAREGFRALRDHLEGDSPSEAAIRFVPTYGLRALTLMPVLTGIQKRFPETSLATAARQTIKDYFSFRRVQS